MESFESGIKILRQNESFEQAQLKGLNLKLLASSDQTEVILHSLKAGTEWAMVPEEGWSAQEYLYMLKGQLLYQHDKKEKRLFPGDSCVASPIKEHTIFVAETDVEFLYVSSQPVFWIYRDSMQKMMDLAVEIEKKDGYTADHCERIKRFSMLVGEAMNLSSSQLYYLYLAAFFHDLGKVRVPPEILNKPSNLTLDEFEIIKKHTTFGRELLAESSHPEMEQVGRIVEQHHEKFDGTGYPNGLKGDDIMIEAAIIAVVDSYDAMTSDRVYQKARSKEVALAEIDRCRGTHYHPEVVDVFLSLTDQID